MTTYVLVHAYVLLCGLVSFLSGQLVLVHAHSIACLLRLISHTRVRTHLHGTGDPRQASAGWVPSKPTSSTATATLDPEGNPKYHYHARLSGLTPDTDFYAVPTDFHPDQVFTERRATGRSLSPHFYVCSWPLLTSDMSSTDSWPRSLSSHSVLLANVYH